MVDGKRSNTVFFLVVIFVVSSSSYALQLQTLLVREDHNSQTDVSPLNPRLGSDSDNSLSLEMISDDYRSSVVNNTKLSRSEILKIRLKRDLRRVTWLSNRSTQRQPNAASSSVFSGISQGSGEYFTRLGVGTPSRYVDMVLDTGSDITWLQCAPCTKCYNQSDSIFDPNKSKSYRNLSCASTTCKQLKPPGRCNSNGNSCNYKVGYGDGSFTTGDLSTETFTLRKNKVKGIAFGCGHNNQGLFAGAAGLLGLGRGTLSFPNQAVKQYDRKFSYCLVARGSTNKSSILFGNTSLSRKARFTPMISSKKMSTFYYINLTGISVGGHLVSGIAPWISEIHELGRGGGVIVDSGTVVTRLEKSAYVALRDAFIKRASDFTRADSPISIFDTCYDFSKLANVSVPKVELHFDGEVNMDLPADNFLAEVDDAGTYCFAFAPAKGLSIIGNIQQQGFRVSFDLARKGIGFTRNSC